MNRSLWSNVLIVFVSSLLDCSQLCGLCLHLLWCGFFQYFEYSCPTYEIQKLSNLWENLGGINKLNPFVLCPIISVICNFKFCLADWIKPQKRGPYYNLFHSLSIWSLPCTSYQFMVNCRLIYLHDISLHSTSVPWYQTFLLPSIWWQKLWNILRAVAIWFCTMRTSWKITR